jgi:hypothetical protein
MTNYIYCNGVLIKAETKEELEEKIQIEKEIQRCCYKRMPKLFEEFKETFNEYYDEIESYAFEKIILAEDQMLPKKFLSEMPNINIKQLKQMLNHVRELFRFYLILREEYTMSKFLIYNSTSVCTIKRIRKRIQNMKG